jgi:hypothetical protein
MKYAELARRDDKTKTAMDFYEKTVKEFPEASKELGLGDRALAFASGEGISDLPPSLAKYRKDVEEAQMAAAVSKAAAQPPAQNKPEPTSADQTAVLKAATSRAALSDPSLKTSPTNSPTP